MARNNADAIRERFHRLAGLLTGISAGLYCARTAKDRESILSSISDTERLLLQVEQELKLLKTVIHPVANSGEDE